MKAAKNETLKAAETARSWRGSTIFLCVSFAKEENAGCGASNGRECIADGSGIQLQLQARIGNASPKRVQRKAAKSRRICVSRKALALYARRRVTYTGMLALCHRFQP